MPGNAFKTLKHVATLSGTRLCCCYSVCSRLIFQVQSTVNVILRAHVLCFRYKLLLLLFCVLVSYVSGTKYCCCYSVCSCLMFQVQVTVAVILRARTFCFRCKVFCCCSVCSYKLFQVQGMLLFFVLVPSVSGASYLLLLFCVFVPPVSVIK